MLLSERPSDSSAAYVKKDGRRGDLLVKVPSNMLLLLGPGAKVIARH